MFYFEFTLFKMLPTMIIIANIALNFFLDIAYGYIKTCKVC